MCGMLQCRDDERETQASVVAAVPHTDGDRVFATDVACLPRRPRRRTVTDYCLAATLIAIRRDLPSK
jgi:hypothetical protein